MPPDTSMVQVMAHIFNPSCSNSECPNSEKAAPTAAARKFPPKIGSAGVGSTGPGYNSANSVWKAELRVRYVPKNLKELFERDRTTCHFYFDQVCRITPIQWNLLILLIFHLENR